MKFKKHAQQKQLLLKRQYIPSHPYPAAFSGSLTPLHQCYGNDQVLQEGYEIGGLPDHREKDIPQGKGYRREDRLPRFWEMTAFKRRDLQ